MRKQIEDNEARRQKVIKIKIKHFNKRFFSSRAARAHLFYLLYKVKKEENFHCHHEKKKRDY